MPSTTNLRLIYRDAFRSHYNQDFQSWFERLALALHPDDFQGVRNTPGDGGLDGFVIGSQLVYQVYAPARIDELRDGDTASKIGRDFDKAHSTLAGHLRAWTFIHNHPEGKIGQRTAKVISSLQSKYPAIRIRLLNIDTLWEELDHLPAETLATLFAEGARDSRAVRVHVYDGAILFALGGPVGLLEEKNKANGRFWAEVTFLLARTSEDVRLRRLALNCYSKQGIPAIPFKSRLYVKGGGASTELTFVGGNVLTEAIPFSAGESPMLRAVSDFLPYLTTQYPWQWDEGCLALSGTTSSVEDGDVAAFSEYFQYRAGRVLEPCQKPDVPRLGNEELARRRRQGLLTEDEEQLLLDVEPHRRYLAFCGDINLESENPRVARLLCKLPQRMDE